MHRTKTCSAKPASIHNTYKVLKRKMEGSPHVCVCVCTWSSLGKQARDSETQKGSLQLPTQRHLPCEVDMLLPHWHLLLSSWPHKHTIKHTHLKSRNIYQHANYTREACKDLSDRAAPTQTSPQAWLPTEAVIRSSRPSFDEAMWFDIQNGEYWFLY